MAKKVHGGGTVGPADGGDDPGVWVTIADLAKRESISEQAAAKRVGRLEAQGLLTVRRRGGPRGAKLFNLADFDRGPLEDARRTMTLCVEALARAIDHPARAEELAAAVAKEGAAGARTYMQTFARDLREELARTMKLLLGRLDVKDE